MCYHVARDLLINFDEILDIEFIRGAEVPCAIFTTRSKKAEKGTRNSVLQKYFLYWTLYFFF
jgi:hypothetical protein